MSTIVFVGHEASLTGAPFTQLYLIQWLRAHTEHKVELILLRGGPLLEEFKKVANVHIVNNFIQSPTIGQRIVRKLLFILNQHTKNILNSVARTKPCLIFANTALTLDFAVNLKDFLKVPLIINVHELETIFFGRSSIAFAEKTKKLDFLIPGSEAVKSFYQSFCPISECQIQVVYDFTNSQPVGNSTGAEIRTRFGIPQSAKIVGSIGSMGWRKGPDLFLQIAQQFRKQGEEDVYFIWVGGDPEASAYKEILYDIRQMGLADRVLFVGSQTDLRGFYESFDVFLLTAREDPFPLVCLEAGIMNCPTICFAGAGGIPEYVQQDAGFVVPYADIQVMTEKTLYLLKNEDVREKMGLIAHQRVDNHHTIRTIGPEMHEIIQKFIK